ncbi:hypothetical protein BGZ67_010617 [Mortierella alpina]|nr:hypothetical protein BGZ67_010617 [Mortierella alpina]
MPKNPNQPEETPLAITYDDKQREGDKHKYSLGDGQWHKVEAQQIESIDVKQGWKASFSNVAANANPQNDPQMKSWTDRSDDVDIVPAFKYKWVKLEEL